MPTLNLNQASKLYYGNVEAQKLYKGSELLYPIQALVDPYLANVVLHLKGDGANNSTNIIDSSPTPKTITRFGDTKISTVQSKYGGSSIFFDGTGDYLRLTETSLLHLNLDDFTIEAWCSFNTLTTQIIYGNYIGSTSRNAVSLYLLNNTTVSFRFGDTTVRNFVFPTFSTNTFYHIAIIRQLGNLRVFVNGIESTSGVQLGNTAINYNSQPYQVSGYAFSSFAGSFINGYIDSLRVTKGIARYTTNFNPETDTYLAY